MRTNAAKVVALIGLFATGTALEVHGVDAAPGGHSLLEQAEAGGTQDVEEAAVGEEEGEQGDQLDDIFQEADTDQDGKLSIDEVLQNAKKTREQEIAIALAQGNADDAEVKRLAWDHESEEHLKFLFRRCDEDKDNLLNKAEMTTLSAAESDDDEDEKPEDGAGGERETAEVETSRAEDDVEAASLLEDEVRSFLGSADRSGDGFLSLAEVAAQVADSEGETLAREFGFEKKTSVEERFKAGDVDSDGLLDIRELGLLHNSAAELEDAAPAALPELTGHGRGEAEPQQHAGDSVNVAMQEVKDTFDILDADKDGQVSWSDVKARLNKATDVQKIQDDFNVADTNKDGELDLNDFAHFAHALVERLGNSAGELFPNLVTLPEPTS